MAEKQKFYGVRSGRKSGVFLTWEECKKQVAGFKGAVYKSFLTREEAEAFVQRRAAREEELSVEVRAYVDGSYHRGTREFSFGAVLFTPEGVVERAEKFSDVSLAAMRNVAGELKGAEFAMRFCLEKGYHSLALYYDYAGIEKWCSGEWTAAKRGTIAYKNFYDSIGERLKIYFIKVAAHTGNTYNERVDALAKQALGIRK